MTADTDPAEADRIARERLADALDVSRPGSEADRLADELHAIARYLRGEEDAEVRLTDALVRSRQVHDTLLDVARLFGEPWECGAKWSELTDEERQKVEERHD